MIEMKTIKNRRYMQGFSFEHTGGTITIGEGTIESSLLPEVQFELIFDESTSILHDLYIVNTDEGYTYRLLATYMDGRTEAFYDQDGTLFHRLMTVESRPDGSYSGDFVFIEELKKKEGGYGEDSTPNDKENLRD